MTTHPETQPDQTRIVAFLAEGSLCPISEVATLYEHERAELALGARVTKFVHIFAIRNVQALLLSRATHPLGTLIAVVPVPVPVPAA